MELAKEARNYILTLFGLSWDRALAGLVCGIASLWFFWSLITQAAGAEEGAATPLDGLSALLTGISAPEPAWVTSVSTWLGAPERDGLVVFFAVAAGIAATIYTRTLSTGSEIASVLLALTVIQARGWSTLALTVTAIVVPAAIPLGIALAQDDSDQSDHVVRHFLSATVQRFFDALTPFARVVVAPAAVLWNLVNCYAYDELPEDSGLGLAKSALDRLLDGEADDRRAGLQASVLAGVLLSDRRDATQRELNAILLGTRVTGPTGARVVQLGEGLAVSLNSSGHNLPSTPRSP